jgi:hypothetical protein
MRLAAKSLDNREFLSWLLDRFDPEDMTIQIRALSRFQDHNNALCTSDLTDDRFVEQSLVHLDGSSLILIYRSVVTDSPTCSLPLTV